MYNYQIIYNLIINNKIIDFFILEFIIILALFKFTEIKNIMIILMSLSIVFYVLGYIPIYIMLFIIVIGVIGMEVI
jgi:hypothetical protein